MNNSYNANMYLTPSILNDIETQIYDITNQVGEEVFENETSSLVSITVGDNLNDKTLYLTYPKTIFNNISNDVVNIITTDNSSYIRTQKYVSSSYSIYRVYLSYLNTKTNTRTTIYLYNYRTDQNNISSNCIRFRLPKDFGEVTSISSSEPIYQYLKIQDNEDIIPSYSKHTWQENEILSMKNIDNLENGIKNIGYFYYQPKGWIASKEWLKTSNIDNLDTNLNMQNISYWDINRWINNLSLIDFDNVNNMTIWNTSLSKIIWDIDSDIEWEEF